MKLDRRAWLLVALSGCWPAAPAEEPRPAVPSSAQGEKNDTVATPAAAKSAAAAPEADEELLEFLGSEDADTGDEDWLEYLSQTDIAKAAKRGKTPAPAAEGKKDD